ncbi:hydroxymethylpyrimidine transporter CytX [Syntrophobotulus glycolicus DSM 8271]|uniref:Hydroxymethylpyrimidine transporter CytX n=1 Tax=Syntrophobotulus glycolicus (strain DSM 8271 / FlGlyR) TaxID=645991 RepID=F0SUV7_SYNGF|nr:putative hydroxymethylpyrimidine transporter CytX [Syntrophobotulus glycolicus]ADY56673.1 hydroxymethylpyrimidine transporter CytX [Syntrophobotulus glycolicus DSM 8271]
MNSNSQSIPSFHFFLIWFGAAVSISEILTGGLIAPLGFAQGLAAIVIGHVIGVLLLGLCGIIGFRNKIPAIESTRISFGKFGSYGFSVLNILQLVGWTAVMIIMAARSANDISNALWGFNSTSAWCIVIGALICIWIATGIKNSAKLNYAAISLLFILTVILSTVVFKDTSIFSRTSDGTMSFGAAVELSVIMPLSWLPLIADYTRFGRSSKGSFWGSVSGYFLGSCWMYIIGLGGTLLTANYEPSAMLLAANMGIAALGIVVLATVTTTYLDAYSAGVSYLNIHRNANEKVIALLMCAIGTLIAIYTSIEQYIDFLYYIGSVFAPLFAILLTEYFVFRKTGIREGHNLFSANVILWLIGVGLYYQFVKYDLPFGSTIPVMLIISLLCVVKEWLLTLFNKLRS